MVATPAPAAPRAITGRGLLVRVNGIPAPQGSKRAIPMRNGRVNLVESSKAVGPWREAVRAKTQWHVLKLATRHLYPVRVPVHARLVFWLPRPAGHYGTGRNADVLRPAAPAVPAGKPDLDKLARAVLDGITAGGAIADDALVVDLELCKLYAAKGEQPGVTIALSWDAGA